MEIMNNNNPYQNPTRLLAWLRAVFDTKSDASVALMLDISPSLMSKIRHGTKAVPSAVLLRIHEETGVELRRLRALMGDFRHHTGRSARHPEPNEIDHLERTLLPEWPTVLSDQNVTEFKRPGAKRNKTAPWSVDALILRWHG
jgi:hypothetical protein